MVEKIISEREHALILAAAILDNRLDGAPDDNLAILARQLVRAQETIDELKRRYKHLRVISP